MFLALPAHGVAQRIHPQMPALQQLGLRSGPGSIAVHRILTAQKRSDPLHQKTL